MSDEVRVNGNQFSWASISVRFDGEPYYGFTSINYSDSRERVKAYGMGRHYAPRGRSKGKYSVEPVTLTGAKSSVRELLQQLADASGVGSFGDVEFQIVVQYVESDETAITDTIERCTVTKLNASNEESADPLTEELEIDAMLIRWNDLTLFDNSDGAL